ncbi:MAG: hypothetical protein HFH06_05170 [Lachnospiraceae bacterium]|nr:hypothetical protein [Lachnospiraceae bacterium]
MAVGKISAHVGAALAIFRKGCLCRWGSMRPGTGFCCQAYGLTGAPKSGGVKWRRKVAA